MLYLREIKITDGIADALFYPEKSQHPVSIIVDCINDEVLSHGDNAGYGMSYIAHARKALTEMYNSGNHSAETLVVWC